MPHDPLSRRLTTIVALDVAGYSARTEADEAGTTAEVAALRRVIEGIAAARGGRVFNTAGDGFMLEFSSSLAAVEAEGGEGLMLRDADSEYEDGRSYTLLKVKTFHDAEARILSYYPGKGKHKGVIGGFHVETLPDGNVRGGVRFKLGTGLSDAERRSPPPIGSLVTYRYQELSDSGTPRFASFLRARSNPGVW